MRYRVIGLALATIIAVTAESHAQLSCPNLITLRSEKGSTLSFTEADNNFLNVRQICTWGALADPLAQYLTPAEANTLYPALIHTHAASDVTSGALADARVDGSNESDEVVLTGDVDGTASANDIDEVAVRDEIESVVRIQNLQGAITDAQVPNTITIDLATLATTATTAETGDSAAGFWLSGTVDTARLGSGTANSTTYLRGDSTWQTVSGLSGTGAVDNAILRADGMGGATLQNSKITVADDSTIGSTATAASFPGLYFWLDASQESYADNDPVSTWTDRSGNGRDFTQTLTARPTFHTAKLNGLPTLTFDGSNDCMSAPSIALSSYTLVYVMRSATDQRMIAEHSADADSNAGSWLYGGVTSASMHVRRGSTNSKRQFVGFSGSLWGAANQWMVLVIHYGGTHVTHWAIIDGAKPWQPTSSASGDPGAGIATATYYLGGRACSSLYLDGEMAEVAAYTPALTGPQERALLLALQQKWGL